MTRGEASVYLDGPWSHRSVSANGTRFHIAESGDGPLVLLLHGFPEFWWTWRHQLSTLSAAGFRVVAVDLRGYGGSDKPPRGYDLVTAASDAAGMVRSLGEANAVVVGHDWGGMIAWTMAAYFPKVVRRLSANCCVITPSGSARCCLPGPAQAGPTPTPSGCTGLL
jgi:pimeloyl-ACP methyl ester carboxylesterase